MDDTKKTPKAGADAPQESNSTSSAPAQGNAVPISGTHFIGDDEPKKPVKSGGLGGGPLRKPLVKES